MPLALDKIDIALIKALLEDGRRSYRQLAKISNVSTPTAEARIKRMMNSGLIRGIRPVFDLEKVEQGVSAIIYLKVETSKIKEFSAHISSLDNVRNLFLTTGEWNMIVRVACSSNSELQSIIDTISGNGATLINSQVITRTVKDEQGFVLSQHTNVHLSCDFCGGDVKGTPFTLKVGEGERFFCCKTCLNSYREKFASGIAKQEKTSALAHRHA